MNRKIKILGLIIVAIVATNALAAAVAQGGSLDIGANPAVLKSTNEPGSPFIYTLASTGSSNFNVLCASTTFAGTTQGQNIQDVTVTPTFSGCVLYGQGATVLFNGCKFTFTGGAQAANTFLIDTVACTAGKSIEIRSPLCTYHLPEQLGLSHAVGTNIGGGKEVTLSATVTSITVTQTGAACPDGNKHHSNRSSFTFNWIVKAFKDAGTTQITTHSHQYGESVSGEQVTLVST
jgi:hypothetical protein